MQHAPGTRLGPYEILSVIGAGGMGEVYKAHDTRLGRTVAIKISHERFSDRFEHEARAVAALNHPNVCQLYDVGPDYLVMEFVDGSPIAPVEPTRKLLDLAAQIADGLATAHATGIVHRDLKPDNILVTRDGRIKILDFGLAREFAPAGGTVTMTQAGTVAGTIAYMSPEQARGDASLGPASDQFSFGVILFELAARRRPFDRPTGAETMAAIIRDDVPALPLSVPAPLRWTIERLLSKDPADRYESTRDLHRDLKQMPSRLTDTVPAVEGTARPRPRRLRAAGWVLGAAVAGFLVAALWPGPPAGVPKLTPFASDAEIETMPAWSPKGDRIAYVADVNGVLQIFTKDLALSTPTQMTHGKEWSYAPAWSEDGAHVFFFNSNGLYSVAVAGGEPQLLLSGVARGAVSPDGRSVAAFVRDAGDRTQLAISSPVGTPLRVYSHEALSAVAINELSSSLSFTRDGSQLGLIADEDGHAQLWKLPLVAGAPQRMRYFGPNFTWFTWLPDGRRIVTSGVTTGDNHLTIADVAGGTSYPITEGSARDGYPSLSPDGHELAFSTGEAGYSIVEVPLNGAPPREVLASSRQAVAPTMAPDGVHFAYATNRSGVNEIWLRSRADGSERRIVGRKEFTEVGQLFLDLAISPDGSRIAYRRPSPSGQHEIWISPLSGEAPVRLWTDPAGAFQRGPTWSPDGNWIAYYSIRDRRNAVLKIRVGAGTAPELVTYLPSAAPPMWSPAGNRIAFRDGNHMTIMSQDGKDRKTVSQRRWETYGWSKDGSELLGIALDDSRRLMLVRTDLSRTEERKVADLGPVGSAFDLATFQGTFLYRGFSLTPDGSSILTSVYHMQAHIWLMQNFDRPTRLLDAWWKTLEASAAKAP